jgi:hypothetical protein
MNSDEISVAQDIISKKALLYETLINLPVSFTKHFIVV